VSVCFTLTPTIPHHRLILQIVVWTQEIENRIGNYAASVALYERERITLGDAARLADADRWTMRDILREHGVELRLGLADEDDAAYEVEAASELRIRWWGLGRRGVTCEMTDDDIPANPSVLNTTVLSNFAYIDQLWVVTGLSGICAVPVVREELGNGVDDYPYLQSALDTLEDEIPVATISDTVANREAVVNDILPA